MSDILEPTDAAEKRAAPFDVTDATSIDDAAQQYSRAGFNVVFGHAPVLSEGAATCSCGKPTCGKNTGKHPVLPGWQKIATSDPDLLRDQLSEVRSRLKAGAKNPNIGWCLGAQPTGGYLVAIDVDDAERAAFLQTPDQYGALPATLTCTSGRGVRQFYWLAMGQSGNHLANVAGLGGASGVDVKVQSGYIVVAPSLHLSGALYRWCTPLAPIADLPPEWYLAISPKRPIPRDAASYEPSTMGKASKEFKNNQRFLDHCVTQDCGQLARTSEGRRNHLVFATAVNLLEVASGVRIPGAWDYVLGEVRSSALATGLGPSEVDTALKSAVKHVSASGRVRGPRPVIDFPRSRAQGGSAAGSPSGEPRAPSPEEFPEDGPRDIELILDDARRPAPIAENVGRLLAAHADWGGGTRFDDFRREIWWPAGTPLCKESRALQDADAVSIQGWLTSRPFQDRVKVGLDLTVAGIDWAARRSRFDSLREHVLGLPAWDGQFRDLFRYLGADESDVHRVVGRRWLIGAIARALQPGCTFGGMLILEGLQETYKNRGLEALFGTQFYAELGSIRVGTRDADQLTESTWCLHDDELKSKDAEIDQLKSFVTRRNNSYVPKYGRNVVHVPRRCALVGSTNRGQYLQDEENRRFWPIKVAQRVDVDGLARDRDQIFAEALSAFREGEAWWISPDDGARDALREAQSDRVITDPLTDAIRHALATHPADAGWVTAYTLATWLGVLPERADRGFEMRIGRALRDLGYERGRRRISGGEKLWGYSKVGTDRHLLGPVGPVGPHV